MGRVLNRVRASAVLALALAAGHTAQAESISVKIGLSGPMTGPEATYGDAMVKGARIAIDEAKGINVTLDSQDDACDPQTGVNAANKLLADGVQLIVGYHCSGAALPSLPLYHRAHIPVVITQALHPAITQQGFPEVFRVISTSAQEAPAAADHLIRRWGVKSVALVHDNTAIQKNLADISASEIKALGGTVTLETAVTPHTTEFGVTVANIMSANPDSVFLVLYYPEGALLAKQLLVAGYKGRLLSADAGVDPGFIKIAGEDVSEKVTFITQPVTGQLPDAKAFITAYKNKFDTEPGALAAYTYDGMTVALRAIEAVGSADSDKVITKLKDYKGKGASGPIQFDFHGQLMGSVFVALQVKKGEFVAP